MSGYRPSSSGVYQNTDDWRMLIDRSAMITSLFRKNGYAVLGAGKVYHRGRQRFAEFDEFCELDFPKEKSSEKTSNRKPRRPSSVLDLLITDPLTCRDEDMHDYKTTTWAIKQIRRKRSKPFFLAVGMDKPHLPWSVPQKYYDMYKDKIEIPKVLDSDLDDVPLCARQMADDYMPKDKTLDHQLRKSGRREEAIRAYLACITFADMNVGRLLEALDKSKASKNTVVVFFGDHGFHLGEKTHWRKFVRWEEATRVPFIWNVPGVTKPGGVCNRIVDLMSVYPTLAELCNLQIPKHVEGVSIAKLLKEPDANWNELALSTYGYKNHTLRSEGWRYIRYHDNSEELYDEEKDPYEWKNLAGDKRFDSVKTELSKHLPVTNKKAPVGNKNVLSSPSE